MTDTVNEFLSRGLPKWPQMLVTGAQLTPNQALEIIRRTDSFFDWASGNNHRFIEQAKRVLHLKDMDDFKGADGKTNYPAYHEWHDAYFSKWGFVSTEYVTNSWISCSFVGGPHGWCHPDGTILYYDNVGKWPSVAEVFEDWKKLAGAFPFLDVSVTLMSGESMEDDLEIRPVVSIRALGGAVTLCEPSDEVHKAHGYTLDSLRRHCATVNADRGFPTIVGGSENAIRLEVLESWYRQVFGNGQA